MTSGRSVALLSVAISVVLNSCAEFRLQTGIQDGVVNRDCTLAEAANSSQNIPETPLLSAENIRRDFAGWVESMQALHPDYLLRTDIEAFNKQRALIEAQINEPMSQLDAWRALSRLNPTLNDGHAGVLFPDQYAFIEDYLKTGGSIFPLEVRIETENRLFVISNDAPVPRAVEIVSINELSSACILSAMLSRAHGDTDLHRRELVSRRFFLFYLFLFGDEGEYRIAYRDGHGKEHTVILPGADRLPEVFRPDAPFASFYDFALLPGGVGYLKVGSFGGEYREAFAMFADNAFGSLKAADAKALIIDIRDNGGGDDALWIEGLADYFATRPYRHISRYAIRITEQNADPGDVIGAIQSGEYAKKFTPTDDNENRFSGNVYILIGPYTYSSAIVFAAAMQDNGFAVIAGEETGGFSCQTGRTTKIDMGETGLNAFTPILLLSRLDETQCRHGVRPDLKLSPDLYDPDSSIERLRLHALEAASD